MPRSRSAVVVSLAAVLALASAAGAQPIPREFIYMDGQLLAYQANFADASPAIPYYAYINTIVQLSISTGCGPNTFCPDASVTRETMPVFLLRAKFGPSYTPPECSPPDLFLDVHSGEPLCKWIEALATMGVVNGCGGGNYCPLAAVTRDQMAVFLLRTLDPSLNPPACGTPMFSDVPANNPFCRWIEELVRRGITTGCGPGTYCPTAPVTRGQMAVFLVTTFGL